MDIQERARKLAVSTPLSYHQAEFLVKMTADDALIQEAIKIGAAYGWQESIHLASGFRIRNGFDAAYQVIRLVEGERARNFDHAHFTEAINQALAD